MFASYDVYSRCQLIIDDGFVKSLHISFLSKPGQAAKVKSGCIFPAGMLFLL